MLCVSVASRSYPKLIINSYFTSWIKLEICFSILSRPSQRFVFCFFWDGDVFFCSIKDLNLIFCSELLSNECKVLDLETGRLANGFVSLLSSMPHSLLLSML